MTQSLAWFCHGARVICFAVALFLVAFLLKLARSAHDMYAVVVVFVVDHQRFALILGGFVVVLFIQHCIEWRRGEHPAE